MNTCDTSDAASLDITVNPLPVPTITITGNLLSTGTFDSYQWLLNDTIVTGATSDTYTAVDTGNYQVIVTDANGCSDTSEVANYTTGIETIPGSETIRVYPNPAVSVLNISSPAPVDIAIYSIDGRRILEQQKATQIDISRLAPGTYQMKLTDSDGRILKMEKLLVLPH